MVTSLANELRDRFPEVDADDLAAWLIARGVGKRGGRRRSRRDRPECPEVGQAARRFVRALVRRAEEGDTEAIEQLVEIQRDTTRAITSAGRALHDVAGYSYTDLGRVLGTTRQAARERFAGPSTSGRPESTPISHDGTEPGPSTSGRPESTPISHDGTGHYCYICRPEAWA